MRRTPAALAALLLTALAAGCGGTVSSGTDDATLVLDFTPNAVHAGIYTALARDFDGAEDVKLRVRPPSSSTDAVQLLRSGRAQLAVMSISDLAIARERGVPVKGVMALVQRPLAAVIADPDVRSPRDLVDRRTGVTGLPSDVAVLRSVVQGDGGDPDRARRVTIGFNAVPALLGGRVDAVTAFWNVEGVALKERRPGVREFRVDDFGAPAYPELVLCALETTIRDDPDLIQGTVDALRRGYDEALADPQLAVATLVRRNRGLEPETVTAELRALGSAFTSGVPRFGVLDRARLQAWSRWVARFGIVKRRPELDELFDPRFANGG